MIYQPLITHCVVIHTWPGRSRAVGEGLAELVSAARPLAGCLSIAASHSPDNPRLWCLSMCWNDKQALGAWLAGPAAEMFSALVAHYLVMHIDFQPGAVATPIEGLRRAG